MPFTRAQHRDAQNQEPIRRESQTPSELASSFQQIGLIKSFEFDAIVNHLDS